MMMIEVMMVLTATTDDGDDGDDDNNDDDDDGDDVKPTKYVSFDALFLHRLEAHNNCLQAASSYNSRIPSWQASGRLLSDSSASPMLSHLLNIIIRRTLSRSHV